MKQRLFSGLMLLAAAACSPAPPCSVCESAARGPGSPAGGPAEIELVETAPLGTTLDHADVREAAVVWPEMLGRARKSIVVAQFYASDDDQRTDGSSPLAPSLAALETAVRRGVQVRFLADAIFAPKYPATLERLRSAGVEVRVIDCAPRYGGVHHAKYLVVDGEEAFVGSQNFDWRALSHIQEIGVRLRSAPIAGALLDLFDTDWALADKASAPSTRVRAHAGAPDARTRTGGAVSLYASPAGWLPDETRADLPRLVALLDGAKTSIDLQVLLYSTENRDKSAFTVLDEAVRRAAARGVHVRLLVSHWNANAGSAPLATITALAGAKNVLVRVFTIPKWPAGEIPFARVAHAKYLVLDRKLAWIGTSNWEGDYFLKTRNVAIVTDDAAVAPRLARIFDEDWSSAYAAELGSAGTPATTSSSALPPDGGASAPPPSSIGPARR